MPRAAAKRQGSPGQSRPHLPLVRRQLLLDAPAAHGVLLPVDVSAQGVMLLIILSIQVLQYINANGATA